MHLHAYFKNCIQYKQYNFPIVFARNVKHVRLVILITVPTKQLARSPRRILKIAVIISNESRSDLLVFILIFYVQTQEHVTLLNVFTKYLKYIWKI